MKLEKYSVGIGDRFGHQGAAQLSAFIKARQHGVELFRYGTSRIGNILSSERIHKIRGWRQTGQSKRWDGTLRTYVDADHIGLKTVDMFIGPSNYFTLDVADFIGKESDPADLADFTKYCGRYIGSSPFPESRMG